MIYSDGGNERTPSLGGSAELLSFLSARLFTLVFARVCLFLVSSPPAEVKKQMRHPNTSAVLLKHGANFLRLFAFFVHKTFFFGSRGHCHWLAPPQKKSEPVPASGTGTSVSSSCSWLDVRHAQPGSVKLRQSKTAPRNGRRLISFLS